MDLRPDPAVVLAAAAAVAAMLPALRDEEDRIEPRDLTHWWTAVFAAVAGAAVSSIGPDALVASSGVAEDVARRYVMQGAN